LEQKNKRVNDKGESVDEKLKDRRKRVEMEVKKICINLIRIEDLLKKNI
jgi:hypothetical protein